MLKTTTIAHRMGTMANEPGANEPEASARDFRPAAAAADIDDAYCRFRIVGQNGSG